MIDVVILCLKMCQLSLLGIVRDLFVCGIFNCKNDRGYKIDGSHTDGSHTDGSHTDVCNGFIVTNVTGSQHGN